MRVTTLKMNQLCTIKDPDGSAVLMFLHDIYLNGCLYTGLSASRSALASTITIQSYLRLSDHPLYSKYARDIVICPSIGAYGT